MTRVSRVVCVYAQFYFAQQKPANSHAKIGLATFLYVDINELTLKATNAIQALQLTDLTM